MHGLLRALLLAAVLVSGCGGDSSPTAPTPPQFPDMVGGWGGTLTINAAIAGISGSNTCTESWTITTQSAGQFSGAFQLSGGTSTSCAQSGTVTGTLTNNGTITDLTFSIQIGATSGCTRLSATPYTGVVTGGTSLSAQSSEQASCTGSGVTAVGSRALAHALTKR